MELLLLSLRGSFTCSLHDDRHLPQNCSCSFHFAYDVSKSVFHFNVIKIINHISYRISFKNVLRTQQS